METMRPQFHRFRSPVGLTSVLFLLASLFVALATAQQPNDQLTGNWVVRTPNADGTFRTTYLNLKQDGQRLTGSIRVTQFYYLITESTGGADGFTITGTMRDGKTDRKVQYEGKLAGDQLHISTRRRPTDKPTEMVAVRAPAGEGALPARLPLPALHKVPDNGLARTPPMGWNSWNKFASRVDDATVRSIADAMAGNGMKAAGYLYINIDDTWEGGRDSSGNILTNKKFPDMKALADYVHRKGLKLGIYSSPGPNTCAGYEGSYGHEEQDARTYAAWGIDYLKYDLCGNLWRTTGDIRDAWDSMSRIGFGQNDLAQWARPGHWNDPDMLEIGNGAMSETEYRTHMSLWAMLAAPLLAGNDLRSMSPAILEILTNREVIAIDQDKDGKQGKEIWKSGDQEIWTRSLSGKAQAVALFNRAKDEAKMTVRWADLGITRTRVRDLWLHQDIESRGPDYTVSVPGHGVVMLRVSW